MTSISDIQELALRFNEEEAVWQRFQEKRLTRRCSRNDFPLSESILDHLDWVAAEREIRTIRAVAARCEFKTRMELQPFLEAGMKAAEDVGRSQTIASSLAD